MKSLKHLRQKAEQLRKDGYTLNQICDRLNRSKTTVYYWIKDVDVIKTNVFIGHTKSNNKKAALAAGLANRNKHRKIHAEASKKAQSEWDAYSSDPDFKLFLMLFWCEGYKRTKHSVSVCNSDLTLMRLAEKWLRKINFRHKELICRLQIHADQDEQKLLSFWKTNLNPDKISTLRKSNSNQMKGRNWNSKYGVATLLIHDAYLKTKIDTWLKMLAVQIDRA